MQLYDLKDNKLTNVDSLLFKFEKEIQTIVESNTELLFDLQFICTEFKIGNFRFDSVCFDNESNSFVIIEYKKDHSFSIIDQGFSYLSTMLEKKSDLILEYSEVTGNNLKKSDVDWSQSRVIFISTSFTSHQKNSVNFKDMPFQLWEIKKYSNNLITFNQYQSSSTESINSLSQSKFIKNVNKEIKIYGINDLLKKSSNDIKNLWEKINKKILFSEFEETKFIDKKLYRRFCCNNNETICYFNFRKNDIRIHILGGTIFSDNSKGKNYIELNDFKNLTKRIEKIWEGYGDKHGKAGSGDAKNYVYEIFVENENNLDYIIDLLKQRYDSIMKN